MNATTHLPSDRIPDTRVLQAVWKLLFMRVRITFNAFRHAKLSRKIGMIFLWLMLLGVAAFIVSMSWLLLGVMRSPEFVQYVGVDVQPILASIPALTLSIMFVGTLLTSFGVLLQALYLSGDTDFLLATPVPDGGGAPREPVAPESRSPGPSRSARA